MFAGASHHGRPKESYKVLGFTDKDEAIDQKAQDDYCKLFEGRLTDTHLVALAAIFG